MSEFLMFLSTQNMQKVLVMNYTFEFPDCSYAIFSINQSNGQPMNNFHV